MTQVASVCTDRPTIRAHINGWSFEDTDISDRQILHDIPRYQSVFDMLADGWRLLGPPVTDPLIKSDGTVIPSYDWWLTRERP